MIYEPKQSRPSWVVPAVVLAAMAVVIALVIGMDRDDSAAVSNNTSGNNSDGPVEVHGPQQPSLVDVERRDPADLLAIGPVDAPVGLVVFSDYQCPYCAKWSAETLPLMIEHAEAGDLRIEWRDVNVFGSASERAARAAYAAAQQGSFWDYHQELFDNGDTRSAGELSDDALIALADELGLEAEQFAVDFASTETAQQVAANQSLGIDLGVYSTPAFILGGQPILGAQPSQVFLDAFDSALSAAN